MFLVAHFAVPLPPKNGEFSDYCDSNAIFSHPFYDPQRKDNDINVGLCCRWGPSCLAAVTFALL